MSERSPEADRPMRLIAAAISVAAAVGLAACQPETAEGTDTNPMVEECSAVSIPVDVIGLGPVTEYAQTELSHNDAPIATGSRADSVVHRVAKSIVEITAYQPSSDERLTASGWLTTDITGQEVVVTAAHAVRDTTLGSIRLTTPDGGKFSVSDGCFMTSRITTGPNAVDNQTYPTDIAILKPAGPTNLAPLTVAQREAAPGTQVYTINTQGDFNAANPVSYPITIAGTTGTRGFIGITGLNVPTLKDSYVESGASGGVVVNGNGEATGLITAADINSKCLPIKYLHQAVGLDVAGLQDSAIGPDKGEICPRLTDGAGVRDARSALITFAARAANTQATPSKP